MATSPSAAPFIHIFYVLVTYLFISFVSSLQFSQFPAQTFLSRSQQAFPLLLFGELCVKVKVTTIYPKNTDLFPPPSHTQIIAHKHKNYKVTRNKKKKSQNMRLQ